MNFILQNTMQKPSHFFPFSKSFLVYPKLHMGFPSGSVVNNLSANAVWVRSLGWEDPLEKEMATYSSILAWKIPWTEEPGRLPSIGLQRIRHGLVAKQQQTPILSYWI